MTTVEAIQRELTNLQPIYGEVKTLHAEWQALQQVDKALADYQQALAAEEKALKEKSEQYSNLQQTKTDLDRRKQQFTPPPIVPFIPVRSLVLNPFAKGVGLSDQLTTKTALPPQRPQPAEEALAARRRLQKLLGRSRLDASVLGEINRIAREIDRPLGEALILLDWQTYYAQTLYAGESAAARLARLQEWSKELLDYRGRLPGFIDTLRTQNKRVLPIWERWRRVQATSDEEARDQSAWTVFIQEARQALLDKSAEIDQKITKIQSEIKQLRAEIEQIQQATSAS